MSRAFPGTALVLALLAGAGLAACQGCGTPPPPAAQAAGDAAAAKPTVRLYVLSTVAGALEPCGCSKDQLGGIDHLAAYLASQADAAQGRLVVSAGPLLFVDPTLRPDEAMQHIWKAEAIAQAAKDIGLAAWAPGLNDWAAGSEALAKYRDETGAALVAANLEGAPGAVPFVVREVGGVKIGIVGVADPHDRASKRPEGVRVTPALAAMKQAVEEAKKQGARVLVGLAALPRGEAMRLADALPELHVLVIGKPGEAGHANDGHKPPVLVGSTLVVETANHLQSVDAIDLYVRDDGRGPLLFADAGGVAKAEELLAIASRIRDLEHRINSWELDKKVNAADVAARKADLERLRAEKAKLEVEQAAPSGSFFRYSMIEVREGMGAEPRVRERMLAFYKRVNEHNKKAFADRAPPPVEKGAAGFIGIEACTECHDEERKVWDGTKHAHAYETLQKDFKEYNLDCVSCHVTGYGKPGGSTVVHNEKLRGVQCETCHGPGSLHAKDPSKKGLIILKPEPQTCVAECHHSPHVENFDAVAKMQSILGPGHGMD